MPVRAGHVPPLTGPRSRSPMAENNNDNKQRPNQLNIEISEEVADGIYSNLAIITHSNSEFVVDFVRVMPGVPKAKVRSRTLLTPQHAKRLMRALADKAFPGGVLAVGKDGALVHLRPFGKLSYDARAAPVTANTIYDLASLTKVIVTTNTFDVVDIEELAVDLALIALGAD